MCCGVRGDVGSKGFLSGRNDSSLMSSVVSDACPRSRVRDRSELSGGDVEAGESGGLRVFGGSCGGCCTTESIELSSLGERGEVGTVGVSLGGVVLMVGFLRIVLITGFLGTADCVGGAGGAGAFGVMSDGGGDGGCGG